MKANSDNMLLIYTPKITNRLTYTFNILLKDILKTDYLFTTNKEEFINKQETKISYAEQPLADEIHFKSTSLLYESNIKEIKVDYIDWEGTKGLFPIAGGVLPFDPFAASFFLTSRYEEYLPHQKDSFGRYDPKQSCAYQQGFLHQPLVNIYAKKIKELIQKRYPEYVFPSLSYHFIPTIDIDNAYAYRGKGLWRTLGAYAKALLRMDTNNIIERTVVLAGLKQDPYDTHEYLIELHKQYNLEPVCFMLTANFGKYDRNGSSRSKLFKKLVSRLATFYEIGTHPSYASNANTARQKIEKKRLESILDKPIDKSRQHYIKLCFPDAFNRLVAMGIREDYSMGYPSEIGFRASICTPFPFYDLIAEETKPLTLYPFAVMDATLNTYMDLSPNDALITLEKIIMEVKDVKGTFISLWHNETLSEKTPWEGWSNVYEQMISLVKKNSSTS